MSTDSSPLRVLIVDDSRFARNILRLVLQDHEDIVVVGEAVDGEDGLRKIRELQPDVVTLDYEMPRMNGLKMLAILRQESDIPVVVVSGLPMNVPGLYDEEEVGTVESVLKVFSHDSVDLSVFEDELLSKIRMAAVKV